MTRLWRTIRSGVVNLLRRRSADRDVSDEVRHFMEAAEADLIAQGRTPEESRRAVRLEYGDDLAAREDVRQYGWEGWTDTLLYDLRLSARNLRRSPGFTAVVVLTLGLGIGGATSIFSVVRPVLFEPLPYPDPERLVSIDGRGDDGTPVQSAFGTYLELADRSRTLEALAVFRPWQPTLTGGDEPVRLDAQSVSADYFDVLGVRPALGRAFEAEADRPGGPLQVILGDGLWRSRFGADSAIIGRTLQLDGNAHMVIGVMPRAFENVTAPHARAWTLLQYDPTPVSFETREWGRHLDMIGRTAPGTGVTDARGEVGEIAGDPLPEFPRPEWATLSRGLSVRPLRDATTADARPTMLVFLGAVGLLVMVTCANLTLLLLARSARRRGEFAMRAALGAGRSRLARYLLTESLLLSTVGGLLGFLLAHLGVTMLVALSPASLARVDAVGLDGTALAFALGLTTLVGVAFGLVPGLHRSASRPQHMREAGPGLSRKNRTSRRTLVVAQVAMAVVLLVGTGLILRSTQRLFSVPLGFQPTQVVVLQVHATGLPSGDGATHGFFDRALDAVGSVPGVVSAAMTSQLPLSGDADVYGVTLADGNDVEGANGPAYRYAVSPGYLETMGTRVRRGRALAATDVPEAPPVAVVSQRLASRLFGEGNPIGRVIQVGPPRPDGYTIVGVVDDVKQTSLSEQDLDGVYIPARQWHWADRVRWMTVRVAGDPVEVLPSIRDAIWSVDGDQPVVGAQPMGTLVTQSEDRRRFVLMVMFAFALAATALAIIGLYGVMSGMVAERLPEMGLRAALGAPRERIVGLVFRQGMMMTAAGVALGVLGAAAAGRSLETLLFQVSTLDAVTYLTVSALLVVAAGIACIVPATQAARADPARTLKAD